ncbi:MAG TPA: hypothetical protein VNJ53_06865 [Gaiellaceae bacterium]|nr:hypothetical protein [Gaiellaceae bacterium]
MLASLARLLRRLSPWHRGYTSGLRDGLVLADEDDEAEPDPWEDGYADGYEDGYAVGFQAGREQYRVKVMLPALRRARDHLRRRDGEREFARHTAELLDSLARAVAGDVATVVATSYLDGRADAGDDLEGVDEERGAEALVRGEKSAEAFRRPLSDMARALRAAAAPRDTPGTS